MITLKRVIAHALLGIFLAACSPTSNSFQADADIIRLRHLEHYGKLLSEYHAQTGTYPFIGENDVPAYVFIASPEQKDDNKGGPPYAHKTADFRYLVEELESILKYDIKEYYDPQYEPDSKPNFYIYMVDGGTFNFAIHTHEAFPFSNPIGKGYNKIEITNNPNGAPHLVEPNLLFTDPAFRDAVSRTVSKPAFFTSRENKNLHATRNTKQD
ncbi:MAG: hypothetical protein ABJN69_02165 [Hellea sp.]